MNIINSLNHLGEIVIFNTEDGEVRVQVDTVNETIWLNQKGIAELFGIDISGVSRHIKKILDSGELGESNLQKCNLQIQTSLSPSTN